MCRKVIYMKVYKVGDKVKQSAKWVNQYEEVISINYDTGLCSVKFEDGTIRENVKISTFADGGLGLKARGSMYDRYSIGDKVMQRCGHMAELTSFDKETKLCSVRFDNGVIREGLKYKSFVVGGIGLHSVGSVKDIEGRVGIRKKDEEWSLCRGYKCLKVCKLIV